MAQAAKHTSLDEVHGLRLAGKRDEALRLAISLLEADTQQLGAAAFLVQTLIAEGRSFLAAEVASRLVDAFVRRGDLPQAVVAARAAESGGEDGDLLLGTIAAAFGKGSKRLADVPLPPPPLASLAARAASPTAKIAATMAKRPNMNPHTARVSKVVPLRSGTGPV